MKSKVKKMTATALSAALIASSISAVQAGVFKEYRSNENDYVFKYDDTTGEIKSYAMSYKYKTDTTPDNNIEGYDIVIPSVINGQEITFIDYLGFFDDDKIKTFELPSTLTSIGDKAFYGCDKLEKIDLSYVENLGESAFYSCDSLADVILGDKLTEIKSQTFMNDRKLENIEFGDNIEKIGSKAFLSCKSLTEITLPASLKYIEDSAFKGCTSLKSIDIPYGITELENNIFSGCTSLEYVTIPSSVTKINKNVFEGCTSIKEITIPASCKDIDYTIFDDCKNAVVVCEPGSRAATIAAKKGLKTRAIDSTLTTEAATLEETTEVTTEETTEATTIEQTTEVATVDATEENTQEDTNNQKIYLVVNGKEIDCGIAEPVIKNDRTLVPMRPLFDALDVPVNWVAATKTVVAKKDDTQVELTIGSRNVILNGALVTTDVAPEIINGYTYMPVRFLSESLNLKVDWDKETKTVSIKK